MKVVLLFFLFLSLTYADKCYTCDDNWDVMERNIEQGSNSPDKTAEKYYRKASTIANNLLKTCSDCYETMEIDKVEKYSKNLQKWLQHSAQNRKCESYYSSMTNNISRANEATSNSRKKKYAIKVRNSGEKFLNKCRNVANQSVISRVRTNIRESNKLISDINRNRQQETYHSDVNEYDYSPSVIPPHQMQILPGLR